MATAFLLLLGWLLPGLLRDALLAGGRLFDVILSEERVLEVDDESLAILSGKLDRIWVEPISSLFLSLLLDDTKEDTDDCTFSVSVLELSSL